MKLRKLSFQIGLLLAATVTLPVLAQTAPDATSQKSSDAKSNPKTLQTVTVTAERRTQNLQEVPASVTAFDSAELSRRGMDNVRDLSGAAPGLLVVATPAATLQAGISMRGAAQVNPALFFDPPVSMYVDGVYYGKNSGAVFDLVDLERVEVLHGPQGTLYGRNTYAGAVNFITHKPTGMFNGTAEIDLGNYGAATGKVAMDLPAIGKLKASVGGQINRRDGWVNMEPGSSVSQMNNTHKQSSFIDLLLDATSNLSFNYRFDHHEVNQYPPFGQVIKSDFEALFGIPGVDARSGRQTTGAVDAPTLERMNMDGHSFHATWDMGAAGTLKYIYGHRKMTYFQTLDLDGTILPIAQTSESPNRYQLTSNELQWLGQWGKFDWVAGLYKFSDHGFTDNPQSFFFGASNYNSRYGFATDAKAMYGQIDYKPTDRWTLTVGARRGYERKIGYRFEVGPGIDIPPTQARTSAGATTPVASVSYQASRNVMLYGRYAEGFKGGGFNGEAITLVDSITPFRPEKKKSLEVGVKSVLLGGKLRVNADLFHERNSDLQEAVFTAAGSASSNIVNVGKSHDEGLELESEALVSTNLKLRVNYSYLHEKYDEFMQLGVNVADNRAVIYAPRHTLNVVADATLGQSSYGTWRGLLDYRFTSSFYQYPYQLRLVDPTAQLAANTRIGASGMLNARLELTGMDWGANVNGEVALWVRNLTNNAHVASSIDFGPSFANLLVGYFNEPRTFGVSLIAHF